VDYVHLSEAELLVGVTFDTSTVRADCVGLYMLSLGRGGHIILNISGLKPLLDGYGRIAGKRGGD
jgi:hypothetical protein